MTDTQLENAFLADIAAHPHESGPWLIFADWLTDRDDPRGETVRLVRQLWDEPGHPDESTRYARFWDLVASGVRLPLPRFVNGVGMEFVWVPPGEFWMGGGEGKCGDRRVAMPEPFYLGVHPVTQGQWRALTGDDPSAHSRDGDNAEEMFSVADADLESHPVEEVSIKDVEGFLTLLNSREPERGWVYRLPTKEEWEYACRSPVPSPSGHQAQAHCSFSFYVTRPTNSLTSDRANFDGRKPVNGPEGPYLGRTTKVNAYPANALGVHDLHGNVHEWTHTVEGSERVLCGGSWKSIGSNCGAGLQDKDDPEVGFDSVGFRLARVPSGR